MRRLTMLAALAWLAAGCSLQHVKLYDGPDRPASEHSTLSSVGLYPERQLALTVVEVDGKS